MADYRLNVKFLAGPTSNGMYLKSLEINGFKSFAKKSELQFGCPIVAVVGPNGSGKSNVAEAFSFVLGEQSIKSMRGKRGEDLIFGGSSASAKLGRASVRLTFDNAKKIFNVDFSEIIIERIVYRDGANEYLLNGSKVRLKDVFEFLAQANIGASGHHIISQGQADRILNASIKERKEMIEDALGLKIYQYKRLESERKLDKTTENIAQVNALRKEIAPHIRFLEKQVEKLKRAETLREELVAMYKEYLKREEKYCFNTREKIKKEKEGPAEEKAKNESRLNEVKSALAESESSDTKSKELLSIEDVLQKTQNELEVVRREISRLEGTISAEERSLERALKEALNEGAVAVPLSDIENLKGLGEGILAKAEKEESSSILRGFISELVSLLKDFVASKSERKIKSDISQALKEEIISLKERKISSENKERELERKSKEIENKYKAIRISIEEGRTKGREAEKEMFSLMNRRSELSLILASLSSREDQLNHDEESFKAELSEAQALCGLEAIRYADLELPDDYLSEERIIQEERRKKIERVKIRLEEAGGAGGSDLLSEYDDVKKRDEFLLKETADLEKSAESLHELIADLTEKLDVEFKTGIEKINDQFSKFFIMMFGGGHASLLVSEREQRKRRVIKLDELEGEEDEEAKMEEGIDISVSLPNKRVKGLQMLSGGERALTSIALLFAISQVNPPPFIILDETDAALDEANSKKYGDMIENLSKYSQLILITHNRETMSRAGILYGVTMGGDGISKLLSVKFEEAVEVAK